MLFKICRAWREDEYCQNINRTPCGTNSSCICRASTLLLFGRRMQTSGISELFCLYLLRISCTRHCIAARSSRAALCWETNSLWRTRAGRSYFHPRPMGRIPRRKPSMFSSRPCRDHNRTPHGNSRLVAGKTSRGGSTRKVPRPKVPGNIPGA